MTLRLLFLTPQLPYPPRQGTALRNWGLINHLARRHAVSLLAFHPAGQAVPAVLERTCRQVVTVPPPSRPARARLRALLAGQADLAGRLWSPQYALCLERLLAETDFDVVHVEGLEMAGYLPRLRSGPARPRMIYDAHNAEHVLQRRAFAADRHNPRRWPAALYSWLQVGRLARLEAEVARQADAVLCVSAEDAAALRQLVPSLAPVVVPNGIDLADYTPGAATQPAAGVLGEAALVFTGKMDYRPNVDAVLWLAHAILPRVRAAHPAARFVVVGQQPAPAVARLHGQDGVVVTGAVEDVRPYIAGAAVFVAPLRMGGGTRLKLLEAMALERPVVSTTLGAEGFAVQSGRELLLADTAADFAAGVSALLSDPARAAALAHAGRAFVAEHYDWSRLLPRLESVYAAPAARR